MSQKLSYEEQKRARRKLRGQQQGLRHLFRDIQKLSNLQTWETLSARFSEALEQDAQLDPRWIDTDRYPLALYNLSRRWTLRCLGDHFHGYREFRPTGARRCLPFIPHERC